MHRRNRSDVCDQLPFGHGTAHDGRRCGGEAQLKQESGANRTHVLVVDRGVYEQTPVSDERVVGFLQAETESESEDPVGKSANYDIDHVLHHDIDLVFHGDAARFQHAETCREFGREGALMGLHMKQIRMNTDRLCIITHILNSFSSIKVLCSSSSQSGGS